jgi:hypothetical protein
VDDLRVPLALNVKQVKPDKSQMLNKGQIIVSFQNGKVELITHEETFEIDTSFIEWAQKVGFIGDDYLEIATDDNGDVYFVPSHGDDGGLLIGINTGTTRVNMASAIV